MLVRNSKKCNDRVHKEGTLVSIEDMTAKEADELCDKLAKENPEKFFDWYRAAGRAVIKYIPREVPMSSVANAVIKYATDMEAEADALEQDTGVSMSEGTKNEIFDLRKSAQELKDIVCDNI